VIDGYAIVQNTIGKHKAITYMVGVDPKGQVLNIEVLVYREAKGSEVRTKRFNAQYEGKTVFDPIRINRDIINISGATMSVRSMSAGVKRALVMVDELYLKPLGRGSDTMEVRRSQQGIISRLFGGLLGN
jgi:Na+-translocating ferredoxin:NAD+ oxidoreductase RnfG subunit